MPSNTYILSLVQQALDEIEDRPLEATVRRAVRVASLMGDIVAGELIRIARSTAMPAGEVGTA